MYVCVHVYVYICLHLYVLYVYALDRELVCSCRYVCMHMCLCICMYVVWYVCVCVCTERDGREATALLLRARAIADVLCRPDGKADDSPDGVADEDKAASSWAAGCSALRRGPSSCDSRVSCGCLLSPACSACCRGMSEYFCCCCCCCCCDCCCCCCC